MDLTFLFLLSAEYQSWARVLVDKLTRPFLFTLPSLRFHPLIISFSYSLPLSPVFFVTSYPPTLFLFCLVQPPPFFL